MSDSITGYPREAFTPWEVQVQKFVQTACQSPRFQREQLDVLLNQEPYNQHVVVQLLLGWAQDTNDLYLVPPFGEHNWSEVIRIAMN
jgi:hypothetical protein